MTNPIMWAVSRFKDWKFYRAFDRAPIKRLGNGYVKEVQGNLYAVDIEVIQPKGGI
jgi:hypothetical protein